MTAISQTIPNYVLGISEQPDQLKTPGQVRDLVNVIPDVTGMCKKRPGTEFIAAINSIYSITFTGLTGFYTGTGPATYYDVPLKVGGVIKVKATIRLWENGIATFYAGHTITSIIDVSSLTTGTLLTAESADMNGNGLTLTFVYRGITRSDEAAGNCKWFTINNGEFEQYIGRVIDDGEVEMYRLTNKTGPFLIPASSAVINSLEQGTYYDLDSTTTGQGTGLTVDVVVKSDKTIENGFINLPGKDYSSGDTITVTLGSTDISFYYYETTANVTLESTLTSPGNNDYSDNAATYTYTVTGGSGSGLTVVPNAYNQSGEITEVRLLNPGNGQYLNNEELKLVVTRLFAQDAKVNIGVSLTEFEEDGQQVFADKFPNTYAYNDLLLKVTVSKRIVGGSVTTEVFTIVIPPGGKGITEVLNELKTLFQNSSTGYTVSIAADQLSLDVTLPGYDQFSVSSFEYEKRSYGVSEDENGVTDWSSGVPLTQISINDYDPQIAAQRQYTSIDLSQAEYTTFYVSGRVLTLTVGNETRTHTVSTYSATPHIEKIDYPTNGNSDDLTFYSGGNSTTAFGVQNADHSSVVSGNTSGTNAATALSGFAGATVTYDGANQKLVFTKSDGSYLGRIRYRNVSGLIPATTNSVVEQSGITQLEALRNAAISSFNTITGFTIDSGIDITEDSVIRIYRDTNQDGTENLQEFESSLRINTSQVDDFVYQNTKTNPITYKFGTGIEPIFSQTQSYVFSNEAITGSLHYETGKAGEPLKVTYEGTAKQYLKTEEPSFSIETLTIDDFTFFLNREVAVKMTADIEPEAPNKGFVNIITLSANKKYRFTITESGNDEDREDIVVFLSNNGRTEVTSATPSDVNSSILNKFLNKVGGKINTFEEQRAVAGVGNLEGYTFEAIGTGLLITSDRKFTLSTGDSQLMQVFTDTVQNIALLPTQCQHGYVVKVINSDTEDDDYYVRFEGKNNANGVGYWEEHRGFGVLTTIDKTTMPHEMRRNEDGSFTVRPVDYTERFIGDDTTNPPPSFVGEYTPKTENAEAIGKRYINGLVNFRNRFGFLSGENIILSRPGDYFNFFNNTALTISPKDPIDVSVSDTESATLFSSIETNVGLVLFSENQQFLLSSQSDLFTPSTVTTSFLSSYQYNRETRPIKLGTTIGFINQDRQNSRLYEMQQQLRDGEPEVVELSKIISTKLPANMNLLSHSKGSNMILMSQRGTPDIWCHRYFNTGTERLQSSWFRWEMYDDIMYHVIHDDVVYFIKKIHDNLVLERIDLNKLREDYDSVYHHIYMDSWVRKAPSDLQGSSFTKTIALPYSREKRSDDASKYSGDVVNPATSKRAGTVLFGDYIPLYTEEGKSVYMAENNGSNTSYNVPATGIDSNDVGDIYAGFNFEARVEFPTIYVTEGARDNIQADTTASLTIQRLKFDVGQTGTLSMTVDSNSGSTVTTTFSPTRYPLQYEINNNFMVDNGQITMPVYAKNTDIDITLKSGSPYPFTLISLTWEGNYTNKYYRRA
tara:strand:- start:3801 stop:8330 length:4530 start_codon:yes stop_codon:yes gene_type:complete